MNKNIILGSGVFLILIGAAFYWFLSSRMVNNELNVTVDPALSRDKVKIELGFHHSSDSDELLIKNGIGKVVFDGRQSKRFKTICGENDFYVTYDKQYYTVLRHFIPNDFYDGIPQPHQYNFDLKKEKDGIHLSLQIVGPDGETREADLSKVADAGRNARSRQTTAIK